MKNKGRKHKAACNEEMHGIEDCKGALVHITRDISKMGKGPFSSKSRGYSKKFIKKKWSKRVRGYFKGKGLKHEIEDL